MTANTETAILNRLIEPEKADMAPEAARYFLALDFSQGDVDRMNKLAGKARKGTLSADEQSTMDNYQHVGHLLTFLQAKARTSLKRCGKVSDTQPRRGERP
jgi:hypothetical protein